MCIIRGKPITARNACQAVKCYPGPARPGGLMISRGILSRLILGRILVLPPFGLSFFLVDRPSIHVAATSALSLRSLLPVAAPAIRLHLPAMRATRRAALPPLASGCQVPPDYRDNLRQRQRLSVADMKSLLRYIARCAIYTHACMLARSRTGNLDFVGN